MLLERVGNGMLGEAKRMYCIQHYEKRLGWEQARAVFTIQ